ncbi:MAG: VCBS repeat-containing protein, partial [Desulfuromonadales bacterium]|nr:VCBS repeat-containing protein [Desulfuromonadales bacterium]
MIKRTVLFLLGLLLLMPALSCADFSDQLRADFKPVSGVIVMPVDEEYLIDLDANHGVMTGDLFSVVIPGAPVLHPVTGEQLGTLDQVKGYLQVTEVRSGYSHARSLEKGATFAKGDTILRYSNVKAAFWDYNKEGQRLFAKLRAALPVLDWQNYAEAQAQRPATPQAVNGLDTPLLFIYQNGELDVRGAAFQILHSYSVAEHVVTASEVSTAAPVMPVAIPSTAIVAPLDAEAAQGGIVVAEKNDWQGVRTVNEFNGDVVGLEVADFDGDGQQETAILDRSGKLTLYRHTLTGLETLTSITLHQADKYLAIDYADLDGDGLPEIYLTAINNMLPAALRLEFKKRVLKVTQDNIAYFLRAVEHPGEGRVLLGQAGGSKHEDFGHKIYHMHLKQNKLSAGAVYPTPWKVKLFGFAPFSSTNGQLLYANLSVKNKLRILQADGEELWQSSQVYGGSRNFFQRPDFSGGPGDSLHDVFITPRLESGTQDIILVPSNAGQGIIAQTSNLGPGSIYAMQWDRRGMSEVWHTRPQNGYLADFRLADIDNDGQQELALLMVINDKGFFSKGRASLVIYE